MIPLLSIGKSIWEQKEGKQRKNSLEVCEKKVIFVFICKSLLPLFRIGLFVAAHGCRVSKKVSHPLKSITHILQQWNLAQLYLT